MDADTDNHYQSPSMVIQRVTTMHIYNASLCPVGYIFLLPLTSNNNNIDYGYQITQSKGVLRICKSRMMKPFFILMLLCCSLVVSKTAISEDSEPFPFQFSEVLQSANAIGKLKIIGKEILEGYMFVTLEGRKADKVVFSSNNKNLNNSLNCILTSSPTDSEGKFICLNGDSCEADIQFIGETVRIDGQCKDFGELLIVVPKIGRGSLENVLSKTSGKSNEQLYDLAYNPKEEPVLKSQTTNTEAVSKENNIPRETSTSISSLISEAEELCIELGFEEASDKLSTCILKTIKKLY